MATAECFKCGGSAIADTYEQARKLINHAVGMSRGIKCGDTYNFVQEIGKKILTPAPETPKVETNTKPEKKTTSEKSKTKKSSNSI